MANLIYFWMEFFCKKLFILRRIWQIFLFSHAAALPSGPKIPFRISFFFSFNLLFFFCCAHWNLLHFWCWVRRFRVSVPGSSRWQPLLPFSELMYFLVIIVFNRFLFVSRNEFPFLRNLEHCECWYIKNWRHSVWVEVFARVLCVCVGF